MIQFIKENKKAIIISLVGGIIVFYSQPLLIFVGAQLVNLFVSISSRFSNYYYQLIAQNDPNLITDHVAFVITAFSYFGLMYLIISIAESVRDGKRKLAELERIIKGGKKEEIDVESEMPKLRKNMRMLKGAAIAVIIVSVLFYFFLAFKQSLYSEVNFKNVSFQNRLIVLSVHLSDNEIKQLRAKWVQMKSADDYKQIMNSIAAYNKTYNVPE